VLAAAADQLIPVTLELGGKSPCIVLSDADLDVTARRITWGKFLNAGQTCVAPDYLLVVPELRKPLELALKSTIKKFFGTNPQHSPCFGRLVNERQFDRLEALLEGTQVLCGGDRDRENLYLAPTLVAVEQNHPLMQEEIFGPVLAILEVADLATALAMVNARPQPLAIYLFSNDSKAQTQLLSQSQSGTVIFNDVVLQASIATLPFGGVGASGMGRGHGRQGFETFSNQRSILKRRFGFDLPFRYPPYGNRLRWLRFFLD
jgi:acyl-CoA reductase-like NAD-dependent aldehyde dehydrogenase